MTPRTPPTPVNGYVFPSLGGDAIAQGHIPGAWMWSPLLCLWAQRVPHSVALGRPSSDPQGASLWPLGVFLLPLCLSCKVRELSPTIS